MILTIVKRAVKYNTYLITNRSIRITELPKETHTYSIHRFSCDAMLCLTMPLAVNRSVSLSLYEVCFCASHTVRVTLLCLLYAVELLQKKKGKNREKASERWLKMWKKMYV